MTARSGASTGRPRTGSVEDRLLECPRHGLTDHGLFSKGRDAAGRSRRAWCCRACNREHSLASYHRRRAATRHLTERPDQ